MVEQRCPNPIIGYATAVAFLLAACSNIKIEATDLTRVAIESDQSVIEKSLSKPLEIFEASNLSVIAYEFDKGFEGKSSVSIGSGGGGSGCSGEGCVVLLVVGIVALAIAGAQYSYETAAARKRQKGILATVIDANGKLAFVTEVPSGASNLRQELSRISVLFSSAQSGDAGAMYKLGASALFAEQKRSYWENAANKGNGEAAYNLGRAYQLGSDFEQSDEIAFQWFLKAARLDHIPSYLSVASAYRLGDGESENLPEAKFWLNKAADAGSTDAQRILSDIRRADAKARSTAGASQLLSYWRLRPDILRKAIARTHPEIFDGPWHIKEFKIEGATLVDRDDRLVRLATRYNMAPREGFTGPPIPRTYRRNVVVDDSREAVVEIGEPTQVN